MVVVADASPLHYLVLVGQIELLPSLNTKVMVPTMVRAELDHSETPAQVRAWIAAPPAWLSVRTDSWPLEEVQAQFPTLDDGEQAVIALARTVNADLILMDDRAGVAAARTDGFAVTGTLGILDLAARGGYVDLAAVFGRLQTTSFRCRPELFDTLLGRH